MEGVLKHLRMHVLKCEYVLGELRKHQSLLNAGSVVPVYKNPLTNSSYQSCSLVTSPSS